MVCPSDMTVCEDNDPICLSASPIGRKFCCTGISGNEFDPSVGDGVYDITYTVTELCPGEYSFTITDLPPPEMGCSQDMGFCLSDGVVTVPSGSPAGGSLSGSGMVGGNSFSTIHAGVGTHTITYSVTDPCSGECEFTITVHPNSDVSCPADFTMGEDDQPIDLMDLVSPGGGTFSGGKIFDPASAPLGIPLQIKYAYTDPVTGYTGSCIFYITVYPNPVVICPDDMEMCVDDNPVTLTGTQTGGSFSGAGITGNQFKPSDAGAGVHTIEYCYTDPQTGCKGCCEFTIVAHPLPDVNCTRDINDCVGDLVISVGGATPAVGTYSNLQGNATNVFNPAVAGIYPIFYGYTDPQTGC